ncbi:MAG: hypothetical protein FDZ70_07010 [Actinobacteria bacterium]|nr:MAG: hypothetical protein FDZ70_07010 [Actinomycetota bacterium]
MARCTSCAAEIADGSPVCPYCGVAQVAGQPTVAMPPAAPQAAAYPPQPAVPQPGGYPPAGYAPPPPPPVKSRTGLVIGLIVGIFLLCGVCAGGGVAWKLLSDKADKEKAMTAVADLTTGILTGDATMMKKAVSASEKNLIAKIERMDGKGLVEKGSVRRAMKDGRLVLTMEADGEQQTVTLEVTRIGRGTATVSGASSDGDTTEFGLEKKSGAWTVEKIDGKGLGKYFEEELGVTGEGSGDEGGGTAGSDSDDPTTDDAGISPPDVTGGDEAGDDAGDQPAGDPEATRAQCGEQWILLAEALTYYAEENGAPTSLEDLVGGGYMEAVPECPGGGAYTYDKAADTLECSIHGSFAD